MGVKKEKEIEEKLLKEKEEKERALEESKRNKPSAASIFGGAKPVDTTQREKEIEDKLSKMSVSMDILEIEKLQKRDHVLLWHQDQNPLKILKEVRYSQVYLVVLSLSIQLKKRKK